MSTTSVTAEKPLMKEPITFLGILNSLKQWAIRNKLYFVAFFIPALLTFLAYIIFGIYPFGGEDANSVLCLDLNGQYVYYFEAIRDAFWGDGSIFYNWARNLSGGYMGVIGYYLASPFTLIVILLPEKFLIHSLLIMQLCKLGTAGVTFSYFLQKSKKMTGLESLIFSTSYAMMAYAVIQLIDPMWLDGIVFLPLIMLGIEYLIDDGRRLNFIIPLAIMCFANFYIGYMVCIFVALYFFFYLFFGTSKKLHAPDYVKCLVRIGYSSVLALCCAAFMLLPVYNALKLGKLDFTDPDYSFRFQSFPLSEKLLENATDSPLLTLLCDLLDMIPQFLPAQYDSVNVQGKPEIYCGLLTVVLLPLFFANKDIKRHKKIGYGAFIVVMLTCMLITPIDMWWHGGQVPNWLPFRYSFLLSFLFLSMAAESFANRKGTKKNHLIISAVVMVAIIAIVAGMKFDQMAKGAVWISAALMGIYLIILYFNTGDKVKTNSKGMALFLSLLMIVSTGAEAVYNAVDSMKDIDEEVAYSTEKSYSNYIQTGRTVTDNLEEYDNSLYRSEKTFYRCVNDNAAFGLKGISHSSSVMNTRIINFIETMGYCTHSYYTRYDGNTVLADSLLGIKYVLDRGNEGDQKRLNSNYVKIDELDYDYVDENGTNKTMSVYENTDALSIGYMASEDILKVDHLGNDNPFNSQNLFMSTLAGSTNFTSDGQFESWNEYYTQIALEEDPIIADSITTSPYGEQTKYDVTGDSDPTIDFHLVAEDDEPIYLYFKTEFQHAVNLWTTSWTESEWADAQTEWVNQGNAESSFNWAAADTLSNGTMTSLGEYFEGDNYTIVSLGSYEPGTKITLRMTVSNDYTIVKEFLFYKFNEDLFHEDLAKLSDNEWNITEYSDRKITGTVTAQEGELLMTSIPYEPGWSIKVDGKKVEDLIQTTETEDAALPTISNTDGDEGMVVVVNAFIGLKLSPGEHTITMSYTPPGWWLGVLLLFGGVAVLVFVGMNDRKRYAELLKSIERQKIEEQRQAEKRAKLKSEKKSTPKTVDTSVDSMLSQLDTLHSQGILTDAEYQEKRKKLLKKKK